MGHDSCIWDTTHVYGTWLVYMGHDLFREQGKKKRPSEQREDLLIAPKCSNEKEAAMRSKEKEAAMRSNERCPKVQQRE